MSSQCGTDYGCGVVYKLSVSGAGWSFSLLHVFDSADGDGSQSTPLLDASGNVYGGTIAGGANDFGVVFEIMP